MSSKLKYPKGEVVWVSRYSDDGSLLYIVTSKPSRDTYFLYEFDGTGFVKFKKGDRSPAELERRWFESHEDIKI